MIKKLLALLEYDSPRFRLFHNPENSFLRIASGQAFAALIIAPLYAYIMYRTQAPEIYFWNGIVYAIAYLVICTIFYFIKELRSWLVYAFILEFFVLTFIAYIQLRGAGFQQNDLVFFFLFYLMASISIQRFYPAILFQLGVLLAFLADNKLLEQSENTPFLVVGVFLIVGLSICTVVYLRRQLFFPRS